MLFGNFAGKLGQKPYRTASAWLLLAGMTIGLATAQDQTQTPNQNPNAQSPAPEAGGPTGDVGPYAVPKKKEEPPPPPPEKPKRVEGMPDYSIKVEVPVVNL